MPTRALARARTSSTAVKRTPFVETYRFIWASQRSATSPKDARISDPERAAIADCSRSVDGDGRRRLAIQMRLRLPTRHTGAVAAVVLCIPWSSLALGGLHC